LKNRRYSRCNIEIKAMIDINKCSIWKVIEENGLTGFEFIKPKFGVEITDVHTMRIWWSQSSVHSGKMSLRHLGMKDGYSTPFFVYPMSDELLILLKNESEGCRFEVIKVVGDEIKHIIPRCVGDFVTVPAGTPHAFLCSEYGESSDRFCHVAIIKTSLGDSDQDIIWEPDTERLLRNEHLRVKKAVKAT